MPGIQLLRGLAAILVVIDHTNGIFATPEYFGHAAWRDLTNAGGFSVMVFFVISGFIIAIVSLDADHRPRITRREFARRRFIRIIPFLWVCVIGYNALAYLGTGTIKWWPMLRALIVWPIGELKPNVVWSLRYELTFYVLFALTFLGGKRRWPVAKWLAAPLLFWLPFGAVRPALFAATPTLDACLAFLLVGSINGGQIALGCGLLLGLSWLGKSAPSRRSCARPGWR